MMLIILSCLRSWTGSFFRLSILMDMHTPKPMTGSGERPGWYLVPESKLGTRSLTFEFYRSKTGGLCKGADANRNWGYMFNTGGSSGNTCAETYHGPEAFSEVENR